LSVLVDTSVWSQALRRKEGHDDRVAKELANLIDRYQARIIGPIRQEILSGISDKRQYESLRLKLQAFDDIRIKTEDYEKAAAVHNDCRKRGIQGSHIDFLICAVAYGNGMMIFTLDKDFPRYASVIDLVLHSY
jgi:predicted nucleic acid-binding protein